MSSVSVTFCEQEKREIQRVTITSHNKSLLFFVFDVCDESVTRGCLLVTGRLVMMLRPARVLVFTNPDFFMNLGHTKSISAFALFSFMLASAAGTVQAQMTYVPGDIILGFQATGGDGSSNTYVYNLGAGVGFRDGATTGLIATINTDLNNTFGIGWYERSDVYWGIAGVRDPGPLVESLLPPGERLDSIGPLGLDIPNHHCHSAMNAA